MPKGTDISFGTSGSIVVKVAVIILAFLSRLRCIHIKSIRMEQYITLLFLLFYSEIVKNIDDIWISETCDYTCLAAVMKGYNF